MRYENFDKAFLLAVDIGAKDLFNDLYYCALDRQENQLAEICRKKFKEMQIEELQQHYNKTQPKSNSSLSQLNYSESEVFTSADEYDSSDEPVSDNSYSSSLNNNDIQVSNRSSNRQIDKIYNETQIQAANQDLMEKNEALIKATKNFTISINNFSF